ncbi:MAG: hypothetical protein COV76_04450 [Candidatus Omnitrophica bacterium CG11_big_fil_rev_8_21_14_0_20_64_10]|nr:MAG: hypothetical protein COV76_04450 [Candidatus Omnitrophica bacterium CG11_big_fil_rev_8_21_14_0_20_64_10]
MGHIRLGVLPRTRNWRQVVALLDESLDAPRIASATLEAASRSFRTAADDPGLVYSAWLLTQLPLEARQTDFANRLRSHGIDLSPQATILELTTALAEAVDREAQRSKRRTDIGEMARLAATESLTAFCAEKTHSLFGSGIEDLRLAVKDLSTPKQFSLLARGFLTRFLNRYLGYFLSRELSRRVGPNGPLPNIKAHTEFNEALRLHCHQATRIVEEFAGGWFSKTNFEGGITPEKTRAFLHVALGKIRNELQRRRPEDEP